MPSRRSGARGGMLVLPALAVTVAVFLLPLLLLARFSLNRFVPGQFMVEALTLGNYLHVVEDPYYRAVLLTTVLMAAAITALSLLIGFPLAHCISLSTSWKKPLILLVVIPLFVGNAVRAAGWMLAFGEQGVVNVLLLDLHVTAHPLTIMFTPFAVLVGATAVNIPFVTLTIQSVLESISPSVTEAASSLGARPFETFRKVTLPLAMPGVRAATVLSFILGMNAYATPVLLGGPSFQMMAPVLTDEILAKSDWPVGATLSFVLIATTLLLSWGFGRIRWGSRRKAAATAV